MKNILLVLPIVLVLVLAIYYAMAAWNAVPGTAMDVHAYLALTLGVVFSLAIAAVLVFLLLRRRPDDEPPERP
jgi:hypothetical protein